MTTNPPVCACKNGGEPYELNGIMVTSRDPACRVHILESKAVIEPVSAERVVGSWVGREREK